MRNYITIKFVLLLSLSLCFRNISAQTEFYDCPKEKKYEFVPDATLFPKYSLGQDSVYWNWKVDIGRSIVFKYEQHYDCSGTGHFGVIGSLLWSIPKDSTQFQIQLNTAGSLKSPLVYFARCGPPCREYNFQMINVTGNIQGTLINNVWHVKGQIIMQLLNKDLNILTSKDLLVDGFYVLWKQKGKDKKGYKFNGF
jgi:hypothetical protein